MAQTALGLLLQYLREERRLSLRELAQLADVDHGYIHRLEAGKKESPSEEVATKLIRALKMSKRDAAVLRFLVERPGTDPELVKYVQQDPSIDYEIFASVAGLAFRGRAPGYAERFQRMRKFLNEEDLSG